MEGWVGLDTIRIFAHHGVYEEERKKGTYFLIDIRVLTNIIKAAEDDELEGTVNYEILYQVCEEEMSKTSKLLENVAYRILKRLKAEVSGIKKVHIKILKENPPIKGDCTGSFVEISQ